MKSRPAKRNVRPRIHITALASSAARDVDRLGVGGIRGMIDLAQGAIGDRYQVTASAGMILCRQDDMCGGRPDDAERVRELQSILADDAVAALVTIRGGAWFTRILDRVDFDALARRRTTLHIFGFSEMTTLIDIAGLYPKAIALYDLGPAFLYGGLEEAVIREPSRYAHGGAVAPEQLAGFAAGYAAARYPTEFAAFFREVADILDGRGSSRVPSGTLLAGTLAPSQTIRITGGCLSVANALLGTPYAKAIDTRGRWLALEDINEAPDPLDRMMAALKLNGMFDRAEGVILGRFFDHRVDMSDAAFNILRHHLPLRRRLPVVRIENFGHVYPIAPLPMHRRLTLRSKRSGRGPVRVSIEIPWRHLGRA